MFKFFKNALSNSKKKNSQPPSRKDSHLDREVNALYSVLVEAIGSDKLVIQAGKMDALRYMRSEDPSERLLALRRILEENPTINQVQSDLQKEISEISEMIADILARRSLEDKIEKRINEKLEKEHQDYVKDLRLQVLRDEKPDLESPHDAKKREELERLDKIKLTQSVMELLRPKSLEEIVGQESIKTRLSISSAFDSLWTSRRWKNYCRSIGFGGSSRKISISICRRCSIRRNRWDNSSMGSSRRDKSIARLSS